MKQAFKKTGRAQETNQEDLISLVMMPLKAINSVGLMILRNK